MDIPTSASATQTCSDLASALASRIPYVAAVGGRPVTHLAELLDGRARRFEWSINEKCAAEAAVGLSSAGARSALVIKHNGLSIALDSLLNAGAHSTGSALVIVVGDDPGASSSTTVQDSRMLAEFAQLPMLEPVLDGDVEAITDLAVRVSEQHRTPVVIRVTPALHHRCPVAPGPRGAVPAPPAAARLAGPHQQVDRSLAHELTKLGRRQRQRITTLPQVGRTFGDRLVQTRCRTPCRDSVIAVGPVARRLGEAAARPDLCTLTLRAGWPLPPEAVAFADRHSSVLVAEDSAPFLEGFLLRHVADRSAVRGRISGHLPAEGALSAEDIRQAAAGSRPHVPAAAERKSAVPPAPGRYDTLFRAVALLHADGIFVAADVGSSVRLCYPPYRGADVALALGSATGVAGGAARTGRPTIAVIGDYALLHSGLEPLLEAVRHELPTLTVVLDNGVQAQTGGQPVPRVPMLPLVASCGITTADSWAVDDLSVHATTRRLTGLLRGPLPAVAFVRSEPSESA